MHLLPLDRRTIFSRNVFCGATSPLLPPAMVILAAGWSPGASRRGFTVAGSWTRRPRAIPARSAPCAPWGPGRAGAAAPSGGHPRARFAPPPRGPPRRALARGSPRRSRFRVGGGSRAPGSGAPPAGSRTPPLAGDRAGGSRRGPATRTAVGRGWVGSASLWAQPRNVSGMRPGLGGEER